jgi:hypothetical protein
MITVRMGQMIKVAEKAVADCGDKCYIHTIIGLYKINKKSNTFPSLRCFIIIVGAYYMSYNLKPI